MPMPRIAVVLLLALLAAGCAAVSVRREGPITAERAIEDLRQAEAALAAGDAAQALRRLDLEPAQVPDAARARWHPLRAQLLEQSGDAFGAAAEFAYLDAVLPPEQRTGNTRQIERLLASLPDAALSQRSAALPAGHLLYPHAGRALTQRGLPLPRPYDRGTAWQVAADRPPAEADGYRPPNRIGVLLPLSGSLASAGGSVRDGFLAAWYAETRRRPEIFFYDTEAAGGAAGAYQKAAADGVDFVVGPLSRDAVAALFSQAENAVPMLALNRVTVPPPPGSASFSLAPEDEGVAAADRLLRRGLKRVVAIVDSDETARRSLAAFAERMRERGGEIATEITLVGTGPDYTPALRQGAMQAQQGGFNAIFLALKAPQARLLMSQLPAAGLSGRPLVATSLILSGGGDARLDKELDGTEYPELPWLVHSRVGLPDPASLARTLPSARGNAIRLFAFGADAWKLAAYLEHLAQSPESALAGATGELRLDGFGNVVRTPAWAVFSGGRPRSALDGALIPQPIEPAPTAGEPAIAEPDADRPF